MLVLKRFFLLLVVLFPSLLTAQRATLDSLLGALPLAATDTNKVLLYHSIAHEYLIVELDSSQHYGQQGLALAQQLAYMRGQIQCYNVLGNYYERKTAYQKALEAYEQALTLVEQDSKQTGAAILINNIAILYMRRGDYDQALEWYIRALELEEAANNQRGVAESYNNIGVLYYYQQNIDKTLEYFEKSIVIEEQLNQPDLLKKGYNNIGALYDYQKKYDQSLYYYQKSYALSQQLNDRQEMAINLNNIATAYLGMGYLDTAANYLQQAVALHQASQDYRGMSTSYYNFATLYQGQKNYTKAQELFEQSLSIAQQYGLRELETEAYKGLAQLAETREQYQVANDYWRSFRAAKDSLLNTNTTKAIAIVEAKYQVAKKEKALLEKQVEIEQRDFELQQKNLQLLVAAGIGALLLLLGLLVVYVLRQRNQQLERQRALEAVQAQLASQEKLNQQRYLISRDLHDNIGAQLTFIISSIGNLPYGFDLTPALHNKLQSIATFTRQTIRELRDTIWAMNKASISLEELHERLRSFVQAAQAASPSTAILLNRPTNTATMPPLSSLQGMNVYRILQEALNNALKHAQAKTITIDLTPNPQQLLVQLQDDGKGFDKQQVALSHGLHNMQKRAQEIGADFQLDTTLGKGSQISLTLTF